MERQASAHCRQYVLSAREETVPGVLHALLIGRGCNVTLPQCTAGFHYPTENLDCVDGEGPPAGKDSLVPFKRSPSGSALCPNQQASGAAPWTPTDSPLLSHSLYKL